MFQAYQHIMTELSDANDIDIGLMDTEYLVCQTHYILMKGLYAHPGEAQYLAETRQNSRTL